MVIHCKYDELIDVALLKPSRFQTNTHPPEQIERLAKIIKYQGIRRPATISNRTGDLVTGHGLVEAIKLNGWDKVPIQYQDFEDDDQERAHVTSDNSIAAWSEVDLKAVNALVVDFDPNFDIDLLGLRDFTLDVSEKDGDGDEDAVPETPPEPVVKRGELWILGEHRLLIDDCTVKENVDRLMAGQQASLWLSDPPYGINHVEVSQEKGQSKGYAKIANDDLQDEDFKKFIYQCISASLPHMKKGFAFYMWHAMKMQGYTAAAAAAAGILFHRQIIWVKPQFVFGRGHYHWRHELCLMGWLQGNEPPFFGERNQSTVWEVARENDKVHPTQKPIPILEPSIFNHTVPGELVYEPFGGSGSTLIAAEKTRRRCYALELEPAYAQVIIERFEKFSGKKAVREDGVTFASLRVS